MHIDGAQRTARHVSVLTDVIKCRRPIAESRMLLDAFGWDSDPLVAVTPEDVSAVLRDFIAGVVTAGFVAEWAETLECRDDVDAVDQITAGAIFALANPVLEGELDIPAARCLIALLSP